jgi:transcriptional regulator with PAS, ATPase and Fis domain
MGTNANTQQRRRGSVRPARAGRPTVRVVYSPGAPSIRKDAPRPIPASALLVGRSVGPQHLEIAGDPHLSRTHASLTLAQDGRSLAILDSSSTGTQLNGQPIREAVAQDGDVIRVGDTFLVFRADDGVEDDATIAGIVGVAPATRRMRSSLALVGPTPATTLLLGETGTGKELAARALHDTSGRAGAFVAVNCGAIPETLAESQFFGHVAGSYTGARGASEGFFRAADHGTIFLDEIGELPPSMQPKLLRALEERAVMPVGSAKPVELDVRVVAATNRNLLDGVRAGSFRADLYARLAEFVIELPPLRARREDILLLIAAALEAEADLTPELVSLLLCYSWPFNVRELLKVLSSMRIRARGRTRLDADMLDDRFFQGTSPAQDVPPPSTPAPARAPRRARPGRAQLERLLVRHHGLVSDVARETGHSRRQVYRWLEKYGIDPDAYREVEDP